MDTRDIVGHGVNRSYVRVVQNHKTLVPMVTKKKHGKNKRRAEAAHRSCFRAGEGTHMEAAESSVLLGRWM